MALTDEDFRLAAKDPKNSLEGRAIRTLEFRIDLLKRQLHELEFVKETIEHYQKGRG